MTIRLLQGDALTVLRTLPSESVHCAVTSPPYLGLRAYLPDGHPDKPHEIGLEGTPETYFARLVEVFREVRRVLRRDGVCFVNLGDSYASSSTYNAPRSMHSAAGWKQVGRGPNASVAGATKEHWTGGDPNCAHPPEKRGDKWNYAFGPNFCKCGARMRLVKERLVGAKSKDLLMMPFRLALALQADGWWLRSVMPWVKRSCMPESCTDRPTSAIEYVFLLAKSERYYWDSDAVRQSGTIPAGTRAAKGSEERAKHANGRPPEYAVYSGERNFRNSDLFFASLEEETTDPAPRSGAEPGVPFGLMLDENGEPLALDVNPEPFPGAHFATFPTKLVEPLIKAGTSEKGCCPTCGAPWVRVTEHAGGKSRHDTPKTAQKVAAGLATAFSGYGDGSNGPVFTTTGWRQTCACPAADPGPCTVLDPFSGSGTTALVADRLQRHAIGIDLHHTYQEMAVARFAEDAPLFAEVER